MSAASSAAMDDRYSRGSRLLLSPRGRRPLLTGELVQRLLVYVDATARPGAPCRADGPDIGRGAAALGLDGRRVLVAERVGVGTELARGAVPPPGLQAVRRVRIDVESAGPSCFASVAAGAVAAVTRWGIGRGRPGVRGDPAAEGRTGRTAEALVDASARPAPVGRTRRGVGVVWRRRRQAARSTAAHLERYSSVLIEGQERRRGRREDERMERRGLDILNERPKSA